ncbi:MAG: hypothetical protein V9G29_19355 [Burkholderiaceae bacterium]
MKVLRILGIGVGILVALVAAGVGLLHALFDGEKVKAELQRVVLEQKQRKLDIAGQVELSVWPEVASGLAASACPNRAARRSSPRWIRRAWRWR